MQVLIQPQPRLTGVSPRFGASSGGTVLTITGQYLEPLFADADGHCAVSRALIAGVPSIKTTLHPAPYTLHPKH